MTTINWDKPTKSSGLPLGQMLDALELHFGGHEQSKEAIRQFRAANPMPMPCALSYSGSAPMNTRWVPFGWAVEAVYVINVMKEKLQ